MENFNKSRFSEIIPECNNWYKDVDISLRNEEKLKIEKLSLELAKENKSKELKATIKARKAFYM